MKLDKVVVPPEAQPAISAPAKVQKQSVIEIVIMKGSLPFAGQVVMVKTPSGSVEIVTGADGKAHVNAVAVGEYVFTYGNLTSKTIVEGAAIVPVKPPVVVEPEPEAPPAVQKPADTSGLVAGAAVIALGGVVVVLGIIIFVVSRMVKKQKPEAGAHEKEEPAPIEPSASGKPGHAAAHKHGHAHSHEHAHKHEHKKQ